MARAQPKMRRTQNERTEATRAKLLAATSELLVEAGYQGTTVAEICDRAGVSRGGQLHHFPTKAELFAATIGHLFDLRLREFERLLNRRVDMRAALKGLLRIYTGETVAAWLELVVAARHEEQLRDLLRQRERQLAKQALSLARRLLGIESEPELRRVMRTLTTFMDGIALNAVLQDRISYRSEMETFEAMLTRHIEALPARARPKTQK
ncbi:MAG: TetR family transcriptional regulator [Deltaproteobacteria bacterium]|nr:TetR family transcriptional regulator [Deltaproteobacteria bacterium]